VSLIAIVVCLASVVIIGIMRKIKDSKIELTDDENYKNIAAEVKSKNQAVVSSSDIFEKVV